MKRFYETVELAAEGDGFAINLDSRPVKTPGRRLLMAPTTASAEACATEWRAQGDEIDPAVMPVTRFLNTALDRVGTLRDEVVQQITGFGEIDLVCYRAGGPASLVARQLSAWNPPLAWLRETHGVTLSLAEGVMPVDQDADELARLAGVGARHSDFHLAALHTVISILGSATLGLALADEFLDAEAAWQAAHVDEMHQVEQWGEDADEAARLAVRKVELLEASAFLDFLKE